MPSTQDLRAAALALGFKQFGIAAPDNAPHMEEYRGWLSKGYHGTMEYLAAQASLKANPANLLSGVRSVVAVGLNYNQPNPRVTGRPRIARYALGRDYHKVLRGRLKRLGVWIQDEVPGSANRICVDSAPVFERDYARLAGLGWVGKNTMLIDSRRGSWFFIGILLTTAEFAPTEPSVGGCGTCTKCIDACPTGAIVHEDGRWQVDARRCISYLTIEHRGPIDAEFAGKLDGWTFGCDACQEVCPFNAPRPSAPMRGQSTPEREFLEDRPWPDLAAVADLKFDEWDALTRGSAVRRAGHEGLRRNARLNLKSV